MYKYILEEAGNINWMAVFALVTFFSVFVISILMMTKKNKDILKHVSELPLSDGELVDITSKNESK